jgi:hypothetical protein
MSGMFEQPQQPQQQVTVEQLQQLAKMFPGIQQQFAQPVMPAMPQGDIYGAARFLGGDLAIPMSFNVDVPAYERMNMTPGSFQNFMAAQSVKAPKGAATIPVFNPATGTYTTSTYTPPKA